MTSPGPALDAPLGLWGGHHGTLQPPPPPRLVLKDSLRPVAPSDLRNRVRNVSDLSERPAGEKFSTYRAPRWSRPDHGRVAPYL